jgi:uncharacterized protein involved in exopolysaccharide biosynthesis
MELNRFLETLRRNWLVPLACLVVGIVATAMYHFMFTEPQAVTTVAVLNPSRTQISAPPEASFDQVVKSGLLAERVGKRVGESSDDVRRRIWVTLLPGLSLTTPSALFAIHGHDTSMVRAERLVTAAVEEAKEIYLLVNATSGSDLRGSLEREILVIKAKATVAQAAFDDFQKQNDAVDLTSRIASQRAAVATINFLRQQNDADVASYHNVNYTLWKLAVNRQATLNAQVDGAQAELDRLVKLQPRYLQLYAEQQSAQAQFNIADSAEMTAVLGQIVPAVATITVLDQARPETDWIFNALTYALGLVGGLILGFTIVYVRALTGDPAQTAEAAASAFGASVLARIPTQVH